MVLTESTTVPIGSAAPNFTLPDTRTGNPVTLGDIDGPVLVIFMCNHCPYVVHIVEPLVAVATQLKTQGIETIAISANDVVSHPADGPDKMAALAAAKGFNFPYCFDETQEVARAYQAVCTPDIYLLDAEHALFYRGQFDDTRPGRGTAHGGDLLAACRFDNGVRPQTLPLKAFSIRPSMISNFSSSGPLIPMN